MDKLPAYSQSLQPGITSDACQQLRDRQRQDTKFYERGAKSLMELKVGDVFHVKTRQGWVHVVISSKRTTPRSYLVTMANGRSYCRNRRHLRKSPSESVTILTLPDLGELNIPPLEAQSTVDMAPTQPSSSKNSPFPQPSSCRSQGFASNAEGRHSIKP